MSDKMEKSLYEFRCLLDYMYIGEERVQEQNKLLIDIGIDTNFSNEVSNNIREKCSELGARGWVISPFWEPREEEMWFNTWYELIKKGSEGKIVKYFKENNFRLLNCIRGYARFEVEKYNWWIEAEELFDNKYYFACALVLSAVLEREIRKCPIDNWRYRITQFFKDSISDKITQIYNDNTIEPISKYIDTLLLLPSIDGFIKSYYNSGFRLENKIEPDYLERNWLMHGMTDKKVMEEDCIKLFNVIGSLCYVLHSLFGTDYRQ